MCKMWVESIQCSFDKVFCTFGSKMPILAMKIVLGEGFDPLDLDLRPWFSISGECGNNAEQKICCTLYRPSLLTQ